MKISQVGQGIESSVDNDLSVLKRVAKVLIAVGLVDIAYMVYCIANGQGYSSSLNIFAVIAGIFLWRGHLGAVRIVTRFSALMLTAATGIVLFLLPTLQPAGLWLLEFKLNPVRTISGHNNYGGNALASGLGLPTTSNQVCRSSALQSRPAHSLAQICFWYWCSHSGTRGHHVPLHA
jgi:hypothetical protein